MTDNLDRRERSARRFGIESWAVDSTYHVSDIHVIESLDGGFAGRTGTRLFQELETLCQGTSVTPKLHNPRDQAQLLDLLRGITRDAERGQYPLLHFETHGIVPDSSDATSQGIVLASGESISWQDLAPSFTSINEATRLNLIVFMAACYGGDVATLIQPLGRATVRLILGPIERVSAGAIEKGALAFYRALLQDGGDAAVAAINAALHPGEAGFWKLPAEALFLEILKAYYNEPSTHDATLARAEKDVAPLAQQRTEADVLAEATKQRVLQIQEETFDRCYRSFFFVDKYPEIAERFILSFRRCFTENATLAEQRVDDSSGPTGGVP